MGVVLLWRERGVGNTSMILDHALKVTLGLRLDLRFSS
jgi:hypothetical protein